MNRKIKKILYGLSLLLTLSVGALSISAQTAGAINGRIKWKKSDGKPEAVRPCEAFGIAAYTEAGSAVGNVIRLGFTETADNYECAYSIGNLPEGQLLRVVVNALKDYRWTGNQPTGLFTYRRTFKPTGWTGEVTLMRVKPDLPSRARGDFDMVVVANKPNEKILLNPKIRFPTVQRSAAARPRRSF
ncbi:MAG: hypothetical protein HY231_10910 [Acidobacteria bacterium]|nr:hypothetical protein [Acidobacteriota bacterium]